MNAVVEMQPVQQSVAPPSSITPLTLLLRAIENIQDIDLDKLQRLMELEATWRAVQAKERAEQAKQAYIEAFAQFKQNVPDVVKDMLNKQYGSDYSSLANLVNTVNKALGAYSLNAGWSIDQANGIKVTCIMTHAGGHSEEVAITGPPDTSGTKNPLQAIKSTLTYLEGATFQAITGVVARSACTDDDANGSGEKKPTAPPAPTLPEPPEGYVEWADNLKAVVDEGRVRLLDTWKKARMEYRVYMTKHFAAQWERMKKDSEKVPS